MGGSPPPVPPVTVVSALEIVDRATFDRMTEEDRYYDMHRDRQQSELLMSELQKSMDKLLQKSAEAYNLRPELTLQGSLAAANYPP